MHAYHHVGMGKNTGTPVYCGISLAWYVLRHTCPYRGILVFLFLDQINISFCIIHDCQKKCNENVHNEYFSDPEWNKIPKSEREKMGIVFEEDGEFW